MLDKTFLREHPDIVRCSLQRRKLSDGPVDAFLALDAQWREAITEIERHKAERNRISGEFAKAKDAGPQALDALRARSTALGVQIEQLDERARGLQTQLDALLQSIPNLLADDVPDGADEGSNVELRRSGEPPHFSFEPKAHWEIGEQLGILDF